MIYLASGYFEQACSLECALACHERDKHAKVDKVYQAYTLLCNKHKLLQRRP